MKLFAVLVVVLYNAYAVTSCGRSYVQTGRVINGRNARSGAWPWQALLKVNGQAQCGGSLISNKYVITAAHCIDSLTRWSKLTIALGKVDRSRRERGEVEISAKRWVFHPNWSPKSYDYDIAIIELAQPVRFTRNIQPVCLPRQGGHLPVGTQCFITGFGKTHSRGQMWRFLQVAPMKIVNQNRCHAKNYQNIRVRVTPRMICGEGGYRVSGCQGDSGGPFVCRNNGRFELHGAVSHGSKECSSLQSFSVFARVAMLRDWIYEKIQM